MGIDAEPREVAVRAVCSMDDDFYRKHCDRPGLCNIQLKVHILSGITSAQSRRLCSEH